MSEWHELDVQEHANEGEIRFLMSMRCWVFPFCYVPPDTKNALK